MNYMMNKSNIKYFLRNSKLTSKLYNKYIFSFKGNNFKYESLKKVKSKFINSSKKRINIFLPSFESDFVYGGITTALNIFEKVAEYLNCDTRIIILNGSYSEKSTFKFKNYNPKGIEPNLIFIDDSLEISIGKNDFFIGTFWTTIYCIKDLLDKQIIYFSLINRKFIYLIQDFEPGFYNWSSQYLLCDNTYTIDNDKIIALFNAKSLYEYFVNNKYQFAETYYFEPKINEKLREYVIDNYGNYKKRERIILIYGRPRVDRNSFEIIRHALKIWSESYKDSKLWKIYSLGAKFDDVVLLNNKVVCKGKLSIDDYARIMCKSYAGISLMVSPHPSYPPLEFSTFGLRTITNIYQNKDLKDFNENIISIKNCTPEKIANILFTICEEYEEYENKFKINKQYFDGNSFEEAIQLVVNSLNCMLNSSKR